MVNRQKHLCISTMSPTSNLQWPEHLCYYQLCKNLPRNHMNQTGKTLKMFFSHHRYADLMSLFGQKICFYPAPILGGFFFFSLSLSISLKKCQAPRPLLNKNPASMGTGFLSGTGAGAWSRGTSRLQICPLNFCL